MQRLIQLLLIGIFLGGCAGHFRLATDHGAMARVRNIYVGDFGTADDADIVREKVRLRLLNSNRFAVVETFANADAVLTGAVGVDDRGHGTGLLRLVEVRTQKTIWAHEYTRGYSLPGRSASSRVANQMIDQLLADAKQ